MIRTEFGLPQDPVLRAGARNLENFLKETVSPSLSHESTPKVLGQHPPALISRQDLLFGEASGSVPSQCCPAPIDEEEPFSLG